MFITEKYLKDNPNHIFVFGDNLLRKGTGGAAKLRFYENTYGFITKKTPSHDRQAYYTCNNYSEKFTSEMNNLIKEIVCNPKKLYLISKIGAGLANRFGIFEGVINPVIKVYLNKYNNVKFLW
jgi:hypothetical protein